MHRDRSGEVLRLGTMIRERCAAPIGVLIILVDGLRGQGLGLNLGSRDGGHQGLYQQGGVVGSGSRFLGRRNRSGRSGARSPGRPLLARSGYRLRFQHATPFGLRLSARPLSGTFSTPSSRAFSLPAEHRLSVTRSIRSCRRAAKTRNDHPSGHRSNRRGGSRIARARGRASGNWQLRPQPRGKRNRVVSNGREAERRQRRRAESEAEGRSVLKAEAGGCSVLTSRP